MVFTSEDPEVLNLSSLLQRLRARISPEVKTAFGVILEALFEEPPFRDKSAEGRVKDWVDRQQRIRIDRAERAVKTRRKKKVGGVKRARPAKGRTKKRQRRKIDVLKEPFHDTGLAEEFAKKASPRAKPAQPKPKPKPKSPDRKVKRIMHPEHPQCQARHPNDHSVRCCRSVGHRGRHKDGTTSWERRK